MAEYLLKLESEKDYRIIKKLLKAFYNPAYIDGDDLYLTCSDNSVDIIRLF